MVLKKKISKTITIFKDKDLIMMSNNVTLNQRKLYNVLLYNARQELLKNENKNVFKIDVKELENISQISISNREQLTVELKGLMQTIIEFVGSDNKYFKMSVLVSYIEYKEGFVIYELTNFLCDMLLTIPKQFAIIDLISIGSFKSKFSVALYEYLKTKTKFIPELELIEFKKIIIGDVNLYQDIKHLKEKVLNIATNEITEKTNLNVTYDLISYKGKKYTHIQFFVTMKEPEESNAIKLDSEITEKLIIELNKSDKLDSFKMRYDDNKLKFHIQENELIIISPAEHFKQWLIDNHFDNKIKNILHLKFNLTFDKVILK
jgi:plasmid replication initiation protein